MAIDDRIEQIKRLLEQIKEANRCVGVGSFLPSTIEDLKGHAKGLADEVKDEVDEIKSDIDQWS